MPDKWFIQDDIGQTVHNLIDLADSHYQAEDREIFANELYQELRFLAPYTREEFNDVVAYIYNNLEELWQYYQGKI